MKQSGKKGKIFIKIKIPIIYFEEINFVGKLLVYSCGVMEYDTSIFRNFYKNLLP